MFTSKSLKVTFITIFASLALLLGMFASTGIASAHTASAQQSKTSASQAVDAGRNRHCRLFIRERVVFVPETPFFFNPWFNNGFNTFGNNWWQNRNENFSFWRGNNDFDFNQWDFTNFGGFDQFHNQGRFIIIVTETRICNGHHSGERSFDWQAN
jgi:hypothetical protein